MRLTEDNILWYLSDRNILNNGYAEAKVTRLPGRNFAACVQLDSSRAVFVKQSLIHNPTSEDGLSREAALYRYLGASSSVAEPIKAVTADLFEYDRSQDILVLSYITDSEDMDTHHERTRSYSHKASGEIGKLLALVHMGSYRNQSQYFGLFNEFDGDHLPLFSHRVTPYEFVMQSPSVREFITTIQNDSELSDAIDRVRCEWMRVCLTHGDFRFSNILRPAGDCDSNLSDLLVIDWERCMWGDPAWDVGTLLAEYVRCWAFSIRIEKESNLDAWFGNAEVRFSEISGAVSAFWETYRAQAGDIIGSSGNFQARAVRYAGMHLLDRCAAALELDGYVSAIVLCVLQISKTFLTKPANAATLLGIKED